MRSSAEDSLARTFQQPSDPIRADQLDLTAEPPRAAFFISWEQRGQDFFRDITPHAQEDLGRGTRRRGHQRGREQYCSAQDLRIMMNL